MADTRAEAVFIAHRGYLVALAYGMLGSLSEAEDIAQEAFVRWRRADVSAVRFPRAWLARAVTRLCLNHLSSARVKRMLYFGPWLPEVLETRAPPSGADGEPDNEQLAESLSLALLAVLERLSPTERAVFVLREVFDCEYGEIAAAVSRTETNCRQILARARSRVADQRRRFDVPSTQRERVFEEFTRAVRTGDLQALLGSLAEDAVFVSDGGGRARALPVPIAGAERVGRLLAGVFKRFVPPSRVFRGAVLNGLPGVLGIENGRVMQAIAIGIADGKVQRIYVIANPAKLRRLRASP